MADTTKWKEVSSTMRKGIKRSQRKNLKSVYAGLTGDQRRKFINSEEKVGLREYVKSLEPND